MSEQAKTSFPHYDGPMTNIAVFSVNPTLILDPLLRRGGRLMNYRMTAQHVLEFEIAGDPADIFAPARTTILVHPYDLVRKLIPPGNTLRECYFNAQGGLDYVFEGIDAPEPDGDRVPEMMLLYNISALGKRTTWFERRQPLPGESADPLQADLRRLLEKRGGYGA